MIAERLDSEKIVFGLKGALVKALDGLCARSSIADLAEHFRSKNRTRMNAIVTSVTASPYPMCESIILRRRN